MSVSIKPRDALSSGTVSTASQATREQVIAVQKMEPFVLESWTTARFRRLFLFMFMFMFMFFSFSFVVFSKLLEET